MRIAQIAPLVESCPPQLYGGTERVVSYLTEELVARGHEVTLFASGDSRTRACLTPTTPRALRLAGREDALPYLAIQLAQVARIARHFDVLHFHCDYLHFPVFHDGDWPPVITTLHGRLDLPHYPELFAAFPKMPLVSISNAQRAPVARANWCATVHHGLPRGLISPGTGEGRYLAFLGRISPEKGVDRAIGIAHKVGLPLRIAAKVDAADRDYFEAEIRPLMDSPLVEFVGEIDDGGKQAFLGQAAALLFPIDWPEPFGLVMIEAMAAGTPVVAFDRGSASEVITDGVSGFLAHDLDEAAAATRKALGLDRRTVRTEMERRFTAERMAAGYLAAYERVIELAEEERAHHSRAAGGGMRPAATTPRATS